MTCLTAPRKYNNRYIMNIDNRVCSENITNATYKVVWRNLGNVPLDNPRFIKRAQRLKKHMSAINADIMCFTECRDSDSVDDYDALPINNFLSEIAGFRYEIYNQRGTSTPSDPKKGFYLSILVDKAKFYVEYSKMIPIADSLFYPLTVNKDDFSKSSFNRSLNCVKLYPLINNKIHYKQGFYIITTHLNIPTQDNINQTKWIANNISKITEGLPYILMGDFNFFPESCAEQEIIMSNDHIDCFKGKSVEFETDKRMDSTFVGFINDNFRNKNIFDLEKAQVLDRVFVNKNFNLNVVNPTIDTRLFLEKNGTYYEEDNKIERYDFPSDHFPMIFDLCI